MTLSLAMHPTIRPVTSQLNAILSCYPTSTNNQTRYMPFSSYSLGSGTSMSNVTQAMPQDSTVEKSVISLASAPGAGTSYTFTLYKNGSPTAHTGAIADSSTTVTISTPITYAKGDTLFWEAVPDNTPSTSVWSVGSAVREKGQTMITGDSATTLNTSATTYAALQGGVWSTSAPTRASLFNTAGAIKPGVLRFNGNIGSGSMTVTLVRRRSGSDSDTSITATAVNNSSVNMTGSDVDVQAGDEFYWRSDKTDSIGTSRAYPSIVFEPTLSGEGVYSYGSFTTGISSAANRGYMGVGAGSSTTSVESRHSVMPFSASQSKFRALRDTLPSSSGTVDQATYSDGSQQASVTFTDSTANDLQDSSVYSIDAGDYWGFTAIRSSGSGTHTSEIAMSCVMKAA